MYYDARLYIAGEWGLEDYKVCILLSRKSMGFLKGGLVLGEDVEINGRKSD